jgi:hypothetical protein
MFISNAALLAYLEVSVPKLATLKFGNNNSVKVSLPYYTHISEDFNECLAVPFPALCTLPHTTDRKLAKEWPLARDHL